MDDDESQRNADGTVTVWPDGPVELAAEYVGRRCLWCDDKLGLWQSESPQLVGHWRMGARPACWVCVAEQAAAEMDE